jgi:chemotaxis protein MotB
MQDGTPIIIKKKKGHKHAHHGGAWKVAYADFVTAMMAFFMVMWIMSLSDTDKQLVQAYFEDPTGFSKSYPKSDVYIQPFRTYNGKKTEMKNGNAQMVEESKARDEMVKLRDRVEQEIKKDPVLKDLVDQQSIEMQITAEGLQIELIESELNGEVFFKVGSAEVQSQARQVLAKIAPILGRTKRMLVIEGHTDSRPLNRPDYDNINLSMDRADAVRRLLTQCGVTADQIEGVKGFGDRKPRLVNDPTHFSNRRVTVLLPFVTEIAKKIDELPSNQLKEDIQGVFRNPFGR